MSSCLVTLFLVLLAYSCLILSCPILSCPSLPFLSCHLLSCFYFVLSFHAWSRRFRDTEWGFGFVEGNAWHHSFPPYALHVLAELHGGKGQLLGDPPIVVFLLFTLLSFSYYLPHCSFLIIYLIVVCSFVRLFIPLD